VSMLSLMAKHIIHGRFDNNGPWPMAFRMWDGDSGNLEVFYSPFEHINLEPQVVLVGITPGKSQSFRALRVAQACLRRGASYDETLITAKLDASFGGDMRDPLIRVLDTLQLQHRLGLSSCAGRSCQ
jgi:hypothetical protein